MAFQDYQRTPLPMRARTRVGWVALCVFGLILSPFVGFTIHGKVAVPGLVIGLVFATLPLVGLTVIAILRWHTWRRLPSHIVQEWKIGRAHV